MQGKTSLCWVLVSDKPELSKANVTDGAPANREKSGVGSSIGLYLMQNINKLSKNGKSQFYLNAGKQLNIYVNQGNANQEEAS